MDYQSVITEAWKLFKSGKKYTFWVLGITIAYTVLMFLASFIGVVTIYGNTSVLNNSKAMNAIEATSYVFENNAITSNSKASTYVIYLIFLLCIALIASIIMWIIDSGVFKAFVEKYKSNKDMSFIEVFKEGLRYFLKFFIAQVLLFLPFVILFGVLTLVAIALGTWTHNSNSDSTAILGSLGFILICCGSFLLIPLFILLSMMNLNIKNSIFIDEMGILESLSHSLKFVKKHFWKLLLLIIIAILAMFVLSSPLFCIVFSLGFLEGLLSLGESAARGGSISIAGSLVNILSQFIQSLYLLVLSLYFYCYWIIAYVKLKKLDEVVKPVEISK